VADSASRSIARSSRRGQLTPDSFSDGGRFLGRVAAVGPRRRLVEEGADIVDVGADPADRVPMFESPPRKNCAALRAPRSAGLPVPVSVDTVKPEVMRQAIAEALRW